MASQATDIWLHISFHCDIQTPKSSRFVSRALNHVASRALFQEVYVAIFNHSLHELSHIAEHSVPRLYVTNRNLRTVTGRRLQYL